MLPTPGTITDPATEQRLLGGELKRLEERERPLVQFIYGGAVRLVLITEIPEPGAALRGIELMRGDEVTSQPKSYRPERIEAFQFIRRIDA